MALGDISKGLKAQVRARINEPDEEGTLDAEIYAWLNEAQLDLCNQINDAALVSLSEYATAALTTDEEPYALPADFLRERVVKYKTIVARRWPVATLGAFSMNALLVPSELSPFYYLWDSKLWLRAGTKTAGSYYLNYYKLPTDMSDSVDPTLPGEFRPALVNFAVMRAREPRGLYEESERQWAEYLGMCEVINSRQSGLRPYDNIEGDRR